MSDALRSLPAPGRTVPTPKNAAAKMCRTVAACVRALRLAADLTLGVETPARNVGGAPQGDALFCWPPSQAANDRATTTMLRLAALHRPSKFFEGQTQSSPRAFCAGTIGVGAGIFEVAV